MTSKQDDDEPVLIPMYLTEEEKRAFIRRLAGDRAKDITPKEETDDADA